MRKVAEAPREALDLPRLSRRAAYARVAGLVAVLWGLEMVDQIIDSFAPGLGWLIAGWSRSGVIIAGCGLWLFRLACRHRRPWWQRLLAGAGALAGIAVIPVTGESVDIPVAVAETVIEIILIGAVAADAGIGPRSQLGYRPRWAANRAGRYQGLEVFFLASVGFILTYAAQRILGLPGVPQLGQPLAEGAGYHNMADLYVRAVMAGPHEEILLTAALAVFFLAAARPVWEIAVIAAVLRIVPHLFLQTAALAVAIFAVYNILLYVRSRRIAPIVAAHIFTNIAGLLPQAAGALGAAVFTGCVLSAAVIIQSRIAPKTIKLPSQKETVAATEA